MTEPLCNVTFLLLRMGCKLRLEVSRGRQKCTFAVLDTGSSNGVFPLGVISGSAKLLFDVSKVTIVLRKGTWEPLVVKKEGGKQNDAQGRR